MAVILAVICVIFLSNCGGGGNSSVVPNTNPTTENPVSYTNTPTPVLIQKPIQGYIYAGNITTEDGETVPNINVLDVSACQTDSSGNEPFVTQVANSLKEDYPEDWAKSEVQELYAQLSKTLSESKPLSKINGQVYSAYADSQSATPIPVSSDGHFDNTVLTGATDSTIKLEVALGEDSYAEVETLPSSDNINSSDATSAVLKSCPEKIFAFPGEIVIFRVTADGVNLKKAGLKFALDNPSIGCISQPVYLCIFGEKKYQTSYGCLYVKNGLNTPIDTNITATTNSGLSLKIFTEVIKKTASISGTVYTGSMPLVKAKIKSLGPKACSKADENGNYTLQKVFLGHYRAVTCTYWTMENGQKIRHREVKVIDFLHGDVTGFNFGVPPPTPTPTFTPSVTPTSRPPYDEFYNEKISEVLSQYDRWKTELGVIEANQHTIQWLNGDVPDGPPLPDEIAGATSIGNPYDIWVNFNDGMSICISTSDPIIIEEQATSIPLPEKEEKKPLTHLTASSNNCTVKNADVIMLSPYHWQGGGGYMVEDTIKDYLTTNEYNVKCISTHKDEYNSNPSIPDDIFFVWDFPPLVVCYKSSNWDNIVTPWTIETMREYGIIFINAHGGPVNLDESKVLPSQIQLGTTFRMSCTLDVRDAILGYPIPTPIDAWVFYNISKMYTDNNNKGWWFYRFRELTAPNKVGWVKELALTNHYFASLNANPETNFEGSLIYWCGCWSWHLKDSFNSAKAYVGFDRYSSSKWAFPFTYDFFWFMMNGTKDCKNIRSDGSLTIPKAPIPSGTPSFDVDEPLHATEAINNALTDYYKVNPDPENYDADHASASGCTAHIWQHDLNEHIYFPVPITITVEKK
jgi:hypothetical protein